MKMATGLTRVETLGRALLAIAFCVFPVMSAHGQNSGGSGGPGTCAVTRLRLRIATGGDDLRGGQDNLNILVYFTRNGYQVAANVNHSQNWPNNSVNMVDIPLSRPVPPNEIRALRLVHIPNGSFHLNVGELLTPAAPLAIAQAFQSPDNWNMEGLAVAAIGNGVGGRIASFGFHRFTGSNPDLVIYTNQRANICGSGRSAGNSGGGSGASGGSNLGLYPGGSGLHQVTGGGGSGASSFSRARVPARMLVRNNDILGMVRRRAPESTILASIRTNPTKFDVSNQARAAFDRECAAIKPIGISPGAWAVEIRDIWNAMTNAVITQETNGRGGEGTGELSPQPYPPKGKLLTPGAQQTMLGAQARPLLADGGKSALPAVQRSAVTDGTMGDGSVRTGIAPGGTSQIGVSQTMSASGTGSPTGTMLTTQATGALAPTQSAPSPRSPSAPRQTLLSMRPAPAAVTVAAGGAQVAAECAKDSTFRIIEVTGYSNSAGVVFEQDGGQYTIWGCSFGAYYGDLNGAYLFQKGPTSATKGNLTIVNWSDTSIVVTIPGVMPSIIQGHMFVTLIVHRGSDGKEVHLDGVLVPTPWTPSM